MEEQLAKIDELRRRFNLTYKEAADVLAESGNDLVSALIKLEEREKLRTEEMFEKGPEMWDKVKDKIRDSSKKKVIISKDGKTVAQVPAPVAALGVLGALVSTPIAILAGVGTVAALAKEYSFSIKETTDKPNDNTQASQPTENSNPEQNPPQS